MKLTDIQCVLRLTVGAMFARNRLHFGAGGPGYYGVDVTQVTNDGSQFDLILTFKSGSRYCCTELGCHLPFAIGGSGKPKWITQFRRRLRLLGLSPPGPITINNVHVIVEDGVICDSGRYRTFITPNRSEYDDGPFFEVDPAQ